MTTATTAKKAKPDTNNSTIAHKWMDVVNTSATGEKLTIIACLDLAKQMKKSSITVRETMKVIKDTGITSPVVKVSHVEGLPTMLELQKVAGFSALPLAKQLSTATASYKLLGAGIGEQMPSLEALETEIARERKVKNEKKSEPKSEKAPKAPKTVRDTLEQILAFANALEVSSIGEDDFDLVLEIAAVLEQKVSVSAE